MPIIKHHPILIVLILTAVLSLAACQTGELTPTLTPTVAPLQPTSTPTPIPLGNPGNPILIGYVYTDPDADTQAAIEALAEQLDTRTGNSFGAVFYPTYEQLLSEMEAGRIQAAWLQPITFLYASAQSIARAALLANHFGTYYYGTQFLANIENGFTLFFDPAANASTADAATALQQFDGLRPCWAEEGSISGQIYPSGLLNQLNINQLPGAIVQSHTAVIRSLYIKGICDFGATFSYSGDPRTSSAVVSDLPDVDQRVVIVWQSNPDIPNMNFSTIPTLDPTLRSNLLGALTNLVKTDEGKALLTRATGNYDIQDLRVIDDSVYDALREIVRRSGIDLTEWLGR